MGFSYLKEHNWSEISREERFFCSILYECIRGSESKFIKWLNEKDSQLSENRLGFTEEEIASEWEVAFEVCFYRDIYSLLNLHGIRGSKYSPKRTFDMCLFSENRIVIIEAKAHDRFENNEVLYFIKDKEKIPKFLDRSIKVDLVGLASSEYISNLIYWRRDSILRKFDSIISWDELYKFFGNDLLQKADKVYNVSF